MKTYKYLLSVAILAIATTASAQFANTGSSGGGYSFGTVKTDNYSRFKVSYLNAEISMDDYDDEFEDLWSMKGVSVEYLYGTHITRNLPLFIESGFNVSWATSSASEKSSYNFEADLNIVHLTIPINLAYKFSLNDDFSIDPHVGLGFRLNVLAKESWEDKYDEWSGSWFDEDDVEEVANRFQLCGQAGIGICYKKLYLGWEYSWNFMEFAEDVKINTHYLSIGVNF